MWSENGGMRRSFLNIQLQYSVNFEITNINLKTSYFGGEKTAERIADDIFHTLADFLDKYLIFVSDKWSNVKKAVELLLSKHDLTGYAIHCTAHGIHNLIYKDLLKDGESDGYN